MVEFQFGQIVDDGGYITIEWEALPLPDISMREIIAKTLRQLGLMERMAENNALLQHMMEKRGTKSYGQTRVREIKYATDREYPRYGGER